MALSDTFGDAFQKMCHTVAHVQYVAVVSGSLLLCDTMTQMTQYLGKAPTRARVRARTRAHGEVFREGTRMRHCVTLRHT